VGFLANEEFDKIKARLLANDAQQEKSCIQISHPLQQVYMPSAYIGNYDIMKIDVKGASIQTEITGSPSYMKMDEHLKSAVILNLPSLQPYVTQEGTLYTKLLKALYDCIQSGLWKAMVCNNSKSITS